MSVPRVNNSEDVISSCLYDRHFFQVDGPVAAVPFPKLWKNFALWDMGRKKQETHPGCETSDVTLELTVLQGILLIDKRKCCFTQHKPAVELTAMGHSKGYQLRHL